jgi:hypothetical protein
MSALTNIICKEFEKNVGKNQDPMFGKKTGTDFFAMDLSFRLYNYAGEDGYRHLHIRIYGPMNYVAVMIKEDWTIIHESYMDPNADDGLRPGKDYLEGNTGWMLASYHDSCWRTDGVESILYTYEPRLGGIDTLNDGWYKKTALTEVERQEIQDTIRERDHQNWDRHWTRDKIVGPIDPATHSIKIGTFPNIEKRKS